MISGNTSCSTFHSSFNPEVLHLFINSIFVTLHGVWLQYKKLFTSSSVKIIAHFAAVWLLYLKVNLYSSRETRLVLILMQLKTKSFSQLMAVKIMSHADSSDRSTRLNGFIKLPKIHHKLNSGRTVKLNNIISCRAFNW